MTDRVYLEELAHDSGVKLTKHDLEEALDDLIDKLFEGKSVGGLHLDAYVESCAEEIAAEVISGYSMRPVGVLLESFIRRGGGMKRKNVNVRMPKEVVEFVRRVSKLAGTTQTNTYNVILAVAIVHLELKKP
jgi:hypothetical protein